MLMLYLHHKFSECGILVLIYDTNNSIPRCIINKLMPWKQASAEGMVVVMVPKGFVDEMRQPFGSHKAKESHCNQRISSSN